VRGVEIAELVGLDGWGGHPTFVLRCPMSSYAALNGGDKRHDACHSVCHFALKFLIRLPGGACLAGFSALIPLNLHRLAIFCPKFGDFYLGRTLD
jgi:hypothetical protein